MTTNTSESMVALQPNMQVHDDLAALFSRNLTLTNQQNYDLGAELLKQVDSSPAPTNTTTNITSNDVTATEPEKQQNVSSPIIYSISQHYHHSGHIARPKTNEDNAVTTEPPARPSSEPCAADAVETLLAANGIDPTVLNPPQIQLFRIADDEQKLRLMELWRICPPENNASASNQQRAGDDTWTGTSLEREEMLARMRWEKAQEAEYIQSQLLAEAAALARTQHHDSVMSLDGTMIHNAQQVQQQEDGRWLPYEHMEPYMMSGYEEIMRREAQRQADEDEKRRQAQEYVYKPATDPVYRDAGGVGSLQWQMQMENQYGAFEQFRGQAGAMDAMEIL